MIEVYVESIRVNMTNRKRVVMLKDKFGPRYLPIWIGTFEADAIAIPMQNIPVPRPLAHDLLVASLEHVGVRWLRAVITRLEEETFYATLVVDHGGRELDLDCRPSDAVAAAIRAKIPIYVEEPVMDRAGMTFEDKPGGAKTSTEGSSADESSPAPYWPGDEPPAGPVAPPFESVGMVTEPVQRALQHAASRPTRSDWGVVRPEGLLVGLILQERSAAVRVLQSLSVDTSELADQLEREPDQLRRGPFLTYAAEHALRRAADEAARLDETAVGTEHLLLALAAERDGRVARSLDALGVTLDSLRRQIAHLLSQAPPREPVDEDSGA